MSTPREIDPKVAEWDRKFSRKDVKQELINQRIADVENNERRAMTIDEDKPMLRAIEHLRRAADAAGVESTKLKICGPPELLMAIIDQIPSPCLGIDGPSIKWCGIEICHNSGAEKVSLA